MQGPIPSEDVGGKIMAGKELGLATRCPYDDEGLCAGMGSLVLPLAGESRQFPDWNGRVRLP